MRCHVGAEMSPPQDEDGTEIEATKVTTLAGHESEVFTVAWNPLKSLLASGSGDSSARIWHIPSTESGSEAERNIQWHVLEHFNAASNEKAKDVTTLDWNFDGSLLATGSYDGQARIWNEQGKLVMTLNRHKGPVFSLKWNRTGSLLLSGSVDKAAIVWDTKTGDVVQQFQFHSAPTLDVDWRNSNSFATCSTDKSIFVCKIGEEQPVKRFQGHADEVNAIKWDPTGTMLASCSDDYTAKVRASPSILPAVGPYVCIFYPCFLFASQHSESFFTLSDLFCTFSILFSFSRLCLLRVDAAARHEHEHAIDGMEPFSLESINFRDRACYVFERLHSTTACIPSLVFC